jgi:hypothetical protein
MIHNCICRWLYFISYSHRIIKGTKLKCKMIYVNLKYYSLSKETDWTKITNGIFDQPLVTTPEINYPVVVSKYSRVWNKHEARETTEINQARVTTEICICLAKNTVMKIDSRITYVGAVWCLNENRLKNLQYVTNKTLLKFVACCAKKRGDGGKWWSWLIET